VRDFTDRPRQRRRIASRGAPIAARSPAESAIVGVVFAKFDRVPEANGAFLELKDTAARIGKPAGCTGRI
jgi:hypothetical protein